MPDSGGGHHGVPDSLSFEDLVAEASIGGDTDPDLDEVCTPEEADAFATWHARHTRPDRSLDHRHVARKPADDGADRRPRPRRLVTLAACLVVLGGSAVYASRDHSQAPVAADAPSLTPETDFLGNLSLESGSWSHIRGPAAFDGMEFARTVRAQVRACGPSETVRYSVPPRNAIYRAVVGLEDTVPEALTVKLKITHRGKTVFSQELEKGDSALFTITAIPGNWSTMTLSWAPTDGACGDSSYLVFGDPQL